MLACSFDQRRDHGTALFGDLHPDATAISRLCFAAHKAIVFHPVQHLGKSGLFKDRPAGQFCDSHSIAIPQTGENTPDGHAQTCVRDNLTKLTTDLVSRPAEQTRKVTVGKRRFSDVSRSVAAAAVHPASLSIGQMNGRSRFLIT